MRPQQQQQQKEREKYTGKNSYSISARDDLTRSEKAKVIISYYLYMKKKDELKQTMRSVHVS